MDKFVISIGNIHVGFRGSSIIFKTIKKELNSFPSSTEKPNLEFTFIDKPLTIPQEEFILSNNILINNNSCYIYDKNFSYRIRALENKWQVDIYINFRYPKNILNKINYSCQRFLHWNYLYPHEDLAKNFIYNVFDYISELVMLEHSCQSFIHASSIDKDNTGILLTALGGVGKTTLMTKLVFKYGCKFLADDLSIIDRDFIYFNPKYIQIYPYNLQNNPHLSKKILKKRSILDITNWYCRKWLKGPKSVRRRLSPEFIFGKSKICYKSKLKKIFFLRLTTDNGFKITKSSPDLLANLCTNIIIPELTPLSNIVLSIYSSIRNFFIYPLSQIIEKIRKTYLEIFENKECYILDIPKGYCTNKICNSILETV